MDGTSPVGAGTEGAGTQEAGPGDTRLEGARPAAPADIPACERLLADARRAASDRRGGTLLVADHDPEAPPPSGSEPAGGSLASWSAGDGHVLLVGTLEEAVVGVAAGHVRSLAGEALGVIDCLYVEPEARGVGVGSALTASLVAGFTNLGCTAVDAPALPGDRATKQRLEGAGFSARLLVLHRRLP